jgi:hypothetical protein
LLALLLALVNKSLFESHHLMLLAVDEHLGAGKEKEEI